MQLPFDSFPRRVQQSSRWGAATLMWVFPTRTHFNNSGPDRPHGRVLGAVQRAGRPFRKPDPYVLGVNVEDCQPGLHRGTSQLDV